jgi:hypothetical protein
MFVLVVVDQDVDRLLWRDITRHEHSPDRTVSRVQILGVATAPTSASLQGTGLPTPGNFDRTTVRHSQRPPGHPALGLE